MVMKRFRKPIPRHLAWTAAVLAGWANPCFADGLWVPAPFRRLVGFHGACAENAANPSPPAYRPPPPGGTCWPRIDNCATIRRGAIPQPDGWFLHKWQDAQAAKAEADDFVIYKHEWFKGGTQLGPYGNYHLLQILRRLPTVPFPVLLEVETQDPARNEMRRAVIISYLAQAGIPDPQSRVLLGIPEAGGLYGDEAPRIYQMMLIRQNPFMMMFGMGGFGGGFGGFGGLNTVPGGGTYSGFGGPPVAVPQNLP